MRTCTALVLAALSLQPAPAPMAGMHRARRHARIRYSGRYEAHDQRTVDPPGFTCRDGTHSRAAQRRGACNHHGGVQN